MYSQSGNNPLINTLMAGTITTTSHCLVKDGKAYTGTKEEIVNQLVKYRLEGKSKQVVIHIPGYKDIRLYSFGKEPELTPSEMMEVVVKDAFAMLKQHGYRHYRDIGF